MSKVKRNARGEVTRQELLDATVSLVQRFGYEKTSISRVMKETGMSTSSIYWMFGSKKELISEALEYSYPDRGLARGWSEFEASRDVLEQLSEILSEELISNARGDAVRTGIMLALEGSANDLRVQAPFRKRRRLSKQCLVGWWEQALGALYPGTIEWDKAQGACRMGKLTMWFIDGHFVGDRDVKDADHHNRARVMAIALIAAAKSLYVSHPAIEKVSVDTLPAPNPDDSEEYLLHVTRMLVSKYGYEGASISRICKATGLSRSSVYWRHKDKDALVRAAITDRYLAVKGNLKDLPVDGDVNVPAVLGNELLAMTCRVQQMPATVKAGVLMAVQRWDPPILASAALVKGSRATEILFARWLEESLPKPYALQRDYMRVAWLFNRLRIGVITGYVLGDNEVEANAEMIADALRVFEGMLTE